MSKKYIQVDFELGDVVEVIQHNSNSPMVGIISFIQVTIDGAVRYAPVIRPELSSHPTYAASQLKLHDPDEAVSEPDSPE